LAPYGGAPASAWLIITFLVSGRHSEIAARREIVALIGLHAVDTMVSMDLVKPVTRILEDRLASPSWRFVTHLIEFFLQSRIRLRRAKPKDADLRDRFCAQPFEKFEMHENGSAFLCCPGWLPWPAGNLNVQDGEAVWNSKSAQEIRRSIHEGDFKYCDRDLCPWIVSNTLPTRAEARKDPRLREIIDQKKTVLGDGPKHIKLSNDRSCNLSCPSCRTRLLNFKSGPAYELRKRLQNRLVQAFFSKPTDETFAVEVTGSGDPFASRVFREFLYQLDRKDFPNLSILFQTNGTLFNEKTWRRMHKIHGNVSVVGVSFDAASEGTYSIVRRGGNWRHLMQNIRFLSGLRQQNLIGHLRMDFVVQQANFREMPDFVRMGKELCVDTIAFAKAVNWGSWSVAEYRAVSVWEPDHPEHAEFQRIMADPIFDDPRVFIGNMAYDRQQARERLPEPVLAAAE
jgi:MoaA/NifB/PqqE/SkfB family radical SAM enzyme